MIKTSPVTDQEFLRWLEEPVTKWMLSALSVQAEKQKEAWLQTSWNEGIANAEMLIELRTACDCYMGVAHPDYHELCEVHGEEPVLE